MRYVAVNLIIDTHTHIQTIVILALLGFYGIFKMYMHCIDFVKNTFVDFSQGMKETAIASLWWSQWTTNYVSCLAIWHTCDAII